MVESTEHPEGLTRTGVHRVLESEFGKNWRSWRWWARQFTPTSISAIGAVIAMAGGYIVHLRETVIEVRTKVIVLETKVEPFVEGKAQIDAQVSDIRDRIGKVEDRLDYATAQAGTPPPSSRRAQATPTRRR